jgi:hypothetical protein
MMITEKVFFASTLLTTVGCSPATFRAWRNRNGLFPETKDAGGWNKFSILDVLMADIVSHLTRAGIGAQLAVDVATISAPEISALYGVLGSDKKSDLGTVVMRLLRLTSIRDFPVLEITNPNNKGVSVRLIHPKEMHVLAHFPTSERDGLPLVSTIIYLGRMFADTLLDLVSTEDEFGRARMPIELLTPPPWAKLQPPTIRRKK